MAREHAAAFSDVQKYDPYWVVGERRPPLLGDGRAKAAPTVGDGREESPKWLNSFLNPTRLNSFLNPTKLNSFLSKMAMERAASFSEVQNFCVDFLDP